MHAVILAGGENKRIKIQKGLLEINGKRIIESSAALLEKKFNKVFISTNTPEIYFYLGLNMIGDILDYRGPMTGIFSALVYTGAPEIFVAACDMPFIQHDLIALIVSRYRGQDAVVPVFNSTPQPLLGIYSGKIAGIMENRIRYGNRSMMDLLTEINVYFIKEEDVVRVDPEGKSFVNINTMEEYKKLLDQSY